MILKSLPLAVQFLAGSYTSANHPRLDVAVLDSGSWILFAQVSRLAGACAAATPVHARKRWILQYGWLKVPILSTKTTKHSEAWGLNVHLLHTHKKRNHPKASKNIKSICSICQGSTSVLVERIVGIEPEHVSFLWEQSELFMQLMHWAATSLPSIYHVYIALLWSHVTRNTLKVGQERCKVWYSPVRCCFTKLKV